MRSDNVPLIAAGAAVALWLAAVGVVAAYYVPGAGVVYGQPIDWIRLVRCLPQTGLQELRAALMLWDAAFVVSIAVWLVLIRKARSITQQVVVGMIPLALLCPVNLLGAAAAVYDWLIAPSDGEMVAEHWPVLHSYAAWSAIALAASVRIAVAGRPQTSGSGGDA